MGQDKVFSKKLTLNIDGSIVDLSIPKVMGIINITNDSFYAKSSILSEKDVIRKAEQMIVEGATFLDIGGQSTRPGSEKIVAEEESKRVIPIINSLRNEFPDIYLSIDTYYSEVARQGLEAGAQVINDISGGTLDDKMFDLVADKNVPYVLMHMRGTPQTMNNLTDYKDLVQEIVNSLQFRIKRLQELGVKDIIGDPGFGFAKTIEQNYKILDNLEFFDILKVPLLVGLSRKSMVYKTLEIEPDNALNGTTVLNTIALLKGANILRVHDVREAFEAIELVRKTNDSGI